MIWQEPSQLPCFFLGSLERGVMGYPGALRRFVREFFFFTQLNLGFMGEGREAARGMYLWELYGCIYIHGVLGIMGKRGQISASCSEFDIPHLYCRTGRRGREIAVGVARWIGNFVP